jgi:hypothetical protein
MNANNPEVIAAHRDGYALLDKLFPGAMHEILAVGLKGDQMRQVVLYDDCWIGFLAWAPANDILYYRDRWIGWTPNQRAERLQLVATNLRFVANNCHPSRQDWSIVALQKAMKQLPDQWETFFGYRPLVAESTVCRLRAPTEAFKANRWINVNKTAKLTSQLHWVKLIDPEGRQKLCAKPLRSPAALDIGGHLYGLLPIPDELLRSLRDALQAVPDPRADNRRFEIGSVLAIVAMALICGYNQTSEMHLFAQRLSKHQRGELGLPLRKNASMHSLPAYHVFYRMLRQVDAIQVAEKLLPWLDANRGVLPGVLSSDQELIRDVMFTLMFGYSPIQEAQTENGPFI